MLALPAPRLKAFQGKLSSDQGKEHNHICTKSHHLLIQTENIQVSSVCISRWCDVVQMWWFSSPQGLKASRAKSPSSPSAQILPSIFVDFRRIF